jgi:glucose/arabinose dehydrogenase
LYVALWREGQRGGGILALRDTNADGIADEREQFGPEGGAGIAIADTLLYFATMTEVYRFRLSPTRLTPSGPPDTVVTRMPILEHGARSIAVAAGRLYVNIGVPSNACERDYQKRDFAGANPCLELDYSGGIWLFDALGRAQRPSLINRFATGLRHTIALGVSPIDGQLYGAPHGIDHLDSWWPNRGFTANDAANIPSETLFRIDSAGDYGFPYCMHDPRANRMVIAPAYADAKLGDRCDRITLPLATFAAHSAPMTLAWNSAASSWPSHRGGTFVALHGSLFHAPDSPRGYSVVYVDPTTMLARPFASARSRLGTAAARPSGLAFGRDGTLFVADDYGKRVWAIRPKRTGPTADSAR